MKIVAVIPVKLNNERLPGKNTKELNGKPLLYYVQKNLIAESRIDERYVFCSSGVVKDYILPGVSYLHRPEYLDSASTNFTQIFEEFMRLVPADVYIYAHATAPFITSLTTAECLDKVLSGEYDSSFCASRIQDFLWQDGKPLNFNAADVPRSQDLKPIYRETSGIYVFRKEVFQQLHQRVGNKPYIKEVTYREAIDINVQEDFALAEIMAAHSI